MKHLFSFFLLFTSIAAFAQTPPPSVSEEIIVTASAVPETVESTPASVTVVTKKEIDRRAARDLAEVLREVPGLTISRTGSPGRVTSLFSRGGNSTHTLVLWNGIEINNPYFAGYDWGRFSTSGVEQVEIVRGPYSALYGSDAVAGVVNVLSAPRTSGTRAVFEAGGHGLRNLQLATTRAGAASSFSASYERREDDGFADNDDFSQRSAHLLWRFGGEGSFGAGVAARYTAYELGIPTNLDASGGALIPSPNRRQDGREFQVAVPLRQTFGPVHTELTLAESRRTDDYEDPDDPFGFVSATTESETRRARLTARMSTGIGTIVLGGEYERAVVDEVSNFGTSLEGESRTERSFFIEDRYSRPFGDTSRLELSAGFRYDRYETFGSERSPRIAAAWISGNHKFRGAYGEAFRAPSIGELYFPFSGNVGLDAERSSSIEAGYDVALGGSGLASITLFRSRYRNLIVFDNATFAFANAGRARTAGMELSFERELSQSAYLSASYTLLEAEAEENDEPLIRRPRHSGSVQWGYRRGNTDTNIALLHTGRRDDIMAVTPFDRVSSRAYTTVDVTTQLRSGRFTPYIKVENVTDTEYEEVFGYPSPGRRTIFGVRVGL